MLDLNVPVAERSTLGGAAGNRDGEGVARSRAVVRDVDGVGAGRLVTRARTGKRSGFAVDDEASNHHAVEDGPGGVVYAIQRAR